MSICSVFFTHNDHGDKMSIGSGVVVVFHT